MEYNFHPTVEKLMIPIQGIIARYYGCEFYIVGSALKDPNPRDIDIVVRVPDDLFLAMYGNDKDTIQTWADDVDNWRFQSNIWKLWARDISKQGKELTFLTGRQVDFKTQPASYFDTIQKPKQLIKKQF
jgi:hypothetical protein